MEHITLGQISITLAFLLLLFGNIKTIISTITNPIDKKLEKVVAPIKTEIECVKKEMEESKIDSIKIDLVNLMCFAEQGNISEEQKRLAHELFDEYTSAGRNSYVHSKWDKLVKEGKI